MFPETYGRTLEELAFLFEDRALAEEATQQVEKQMEWSEQRRYSRLEDRLSWDMDVIVSPKSHAPVERREPYSAPPTPATTIPVNLDHRGRDGQFRAIRGERGGWWDN